MGYIKGWICWQLFLILLLGMGLAAEASEVTVKIKDLAQIQGVRANQLNGIGLVVGLNGTGDASKANAQLVVNALAKWGINLSLSDLKVKNIAAVVLTANLPPYLHQGASLDVQVSSLGDAKSLQGGVLLQAPLLGADNKVYAVAQGSVYVGGYVVGNGGSSQQKNIPTGGVVSGGAIVEREVAMEPVVDNRLRFSLQQPDFTTATRLAETINEKFASKIAIAIDMGMIEVNIPPSRQTNPISLIAEIENLAVIPDGLARVIINERTGTILVGANVKIAPVAVTHRNITVKIESKKEVSQPAALSQGETKITEKSETIVTEEPGRMVLLPAGTTIGAVVHALNSVGSTPQDIMAVIVALKEAGALYGTLEFR